MPIKRLNRGLVRSLLVLGYPVMLGNMGVILMGLIDNAMIGALGHVELAASGIGNTIYFVTSTFGLGLISVFSATVSSYRVTDESQIPKVVNSSLLICLAVTVLTLVILWGVADNFEIFRQKEAVQVLAVPYLKIIAISLIPMFLFASFRNVADGYSITLAAMFATLSAVGLNALLNWILIYGNLGFEAYGLRGGAMATLISRIYMALFIIGYVWNHKRIKYSWKSLIQDGISKPIIERLLRSGVPAGMQFFYEVTAFAAVSVMAGWLGARFLAAHQIAISLVALTYMIANGFSVAAMIRMGEARHQQSGLQLQHLGKNEVGFTTLMMVIFAVVIVIFKGSMVRWFTSDQQVIEIASRLLLFAAAFQVFDGVQVVSLGLLRGMEDARVPARLTMLSYWVVALPVSYFFGIYLAGGMDGLWTGLTLGLFVAAALLYLRFIKQTRILS